jgi:putative flippase GtrA
MRLQVGALDNYVAANLQLNVARHFGQSWRWTPSTNNLERGHGAGRFLFSATKERMTLQQALEYLAGPGAAVIAAVLLSFLATRWPWFESQSSDVKRAVMIAVSALLGLAAWSVLHYAPPELLAQLEPIFALLFTIIAPILGNQLWHAEVNTRLRT